MYFDQSATHPINKEVLRKTFDSLDSFYNSNSKHLKGIKAKDLIGEAEDTFRDFFNLKDASLIFTSGASESNNMVILGLGQSHSLGNIIISPFEHSSVLKPISYLQHLGHKVKITPVDDNGIIILDELLSMIDEHTFLISIAGCESELGIIQDVSTIAKAVKAVNPRLTFHSDITQAINKYKLNIDFVDFVSFSGHKFGSLKGIGGIINNSTIKLSPIMYGSDLKPGTKPVELIHNMRLALEAIDYQDQLKVIKLNTHLRKKLVSLPLIRINSPLTASPYILNISILKRSSKVSQALLSKEGIYVSTQSACEKSNHSKSILKLSNSIKAAESSIRISLSPMHTLNELNLLLINLERLCS